MLRSKFGCFLRKLLGPRQHYSLDSRGVTQPALEILCFLRNARSEVRDTFSDFYLYLIRFILFIYLLLGCTTELCTLKICCKSLNFLPVRHDWSRVNSRTKQERGAWREVFWRRARWRTKHRLRRKKWKTIPQNSPQKTMNKMTE